MSDIDDICVVTQPVASASESHVEDMLDILGAITTVSLLTANLPEDSTLRGEYDVENVAAVGTGHSVPVAAARFLRNQLRMARELWKREEGTVLFFGATSYLLPILAAKLSGKRVVLEPRGNVPLTLRLQWERRMPALLARSLAGAVWTLEAVGYRLADGIITYTPSMAEELGLDRYEGKLYPRGARYVDTDRFRPQIPYDERERTVGFLGRLDEEKGVRLLADVAKQLPETTTFVFGGDGDLREWLENELDGEIRDGNVEMVGWVDHEDVPAFLNRLNLLVLPSEPTEGLPTVILEAFACGTPVYATPVSGVPDVVVPGETGFELTADDPECLARVIEGALDSDLERLHENCLGLVREEYSFEAAVSRYREIFEAME